MKKSEGKGAIDEVDWNGWLVTNWNSICKKFVFRVSRFATGTSPMDLGKYTQSVSPSKRHSLGP